MRSLRRALFAWIFPPVFIVGISAAAGAYVFMQHRLTAAYDLDLGDIARALVPFLTMRNGSVELQFTDESEAVLRADSNDQIFYAVRDGKDRLVAGDALLPTAMVPNDDVPSFRDAMRAGTPIRLVVLPAYVGGEAVKVVAAETMRKRDSAARDAAVSALAPTFLLLLAAGSAVAFGVGRGLRPLERLGADLRRRSHLDLSPLPEEPLARELRPLVRALNDMFQRLVAAQDSQARFIANAAHQLRTPIAGLVTQLDLAVPGCREGDPHLEAARQSARRLMRLAQQILSLAAADPVSNPHARREQFDLAEAVRDRAVDWVRAAPANAELEFDLAPAPMVGSAVLLGELTTNLVENATRYGGTLVRIATRLEAGEAIVEVEDNGRGIAPQDRESIFRRFERLGAHDAEGSGLGLAIVHEIAQRHGGRVVVEDGRSGGTRVTARFPASL